MATSLKEIAAIGGGRIVCASDDDGAAAVRITSVGITAQHVAERGLFAAVPGTRTHGAAFAAASQAAAILTDEEGLKILSDRRDTRPIVVVDDVRAVLGPISAAVYGNPSEKLTIIGITGTSGKTTVAHMLETGLMACGYTVGLIGTNGTRIDGEPVPTELTTPEAPVLQELFAHMVERGVTHVVMEVSSHALALGRVAGTRFTVGGFTNLSQDHLDFHHTMDEYFRAKALFFTPGSPVAAQHAVLCVDDPWGQKMAVWSGPAGITVSAQGNPALVTASVPDLDTDGAQHFSIHTRHGDVSVTLRLPGRFNVANATLAVACAEAAGASPQVVADALIDVVVPGRMQTITAGQEFTAVVDYAHKPAALAAVLDELAAHSTGRIACVVGCGGDRDAGKRPIMGAEAGKRVDLLVVTDDNPRSEDPATIRAAIIAGTAPENTHNEGKKSGPKKKTKRRADVVEIADRAEAIAYAVAWAQPGDTVLVAGKGHETGQKIGDTIYDFDDRLVLSEAITSHLGTTTTIESGHTS